MRGRSIFLEHDFRRFYDHPDGIALLQCQFLGASPSDHAFDEVFANPHHDVRHNPAKLDFLNRSLELIPR
jgi:hypothetical protein